MDAELLARLRTELEDERVETIDDLRSMGADPESERVDPIEGIDDNFADSAAATTERGEIFAQIGQSRERLAAIEAAIAKLDAGTYGQCEVCGQPIASARLEARPLSVRCVACAT